MVGEVFLQSQQSLTIYQSSSSQVEITALHWKSNLMTFITNPNIIVGKRHKDMWNDTEKKLNENLNIYSSWHWFDAKFTTSPV